MKLRNFILMSAAFFATLVPSYASTYYGGFEDLKNNKPSSTDNDYNDLVFSLSGNGLMLKTTDGAWYSAPTINNNGDPFWDQTSWDGSKKNVGYCIYGGGDCGTGIAPGARFLANKTSTGKTADNVYFSVAGNVNATVSLSISSASDTLYWYKVGNTNVLYKITTGVGSFTFNPNGDFGLAGYNNLTNSFYYSQIRNGEDPSHFAFFEPVPEPGTMGAMAGGLIVLGAIYRRRRVAAAQK